MYGIFPELFTPRRYLPPPPPIKGVKINGYTISRDDDDDDEAVGFQRSVQPLKTVYIYSLSRIDTLLLY